MQEYFFEDRIYYRKNNFKEDVPTLVFIHGVGGSSSAWVPYEKILEDKYNILSFDIRGHGKSKKFSKYSDYEIANFAFDMHDLVTYLGISKFILVSNSFGALVALEYIKHWKDTVLGNVFTSPEIFVHQGFLAKISRPFLKMITEFFRILPFDSKPRGHIDYAKHMGSTDWDIKRNLADMMNTTPRVHFFTLRKSFEKNQENSLEEIRVPTLIIHGEKDTMVPIKNATTMHSKIKNSEFIIIPNIDHNTAINAVKEMSKAIEDFIEKNKTDFLKNN